MRIINAMFGRNLGGLEQAFVDYASALKADGHEVLNLCQPDAAILETLHKAGHECTTVSNMGQWDIFAVGRIRTQIIPFSPDAAICHGNRAISLVQQAARGICPVVGVAHNYHLKRVKNIDAVFATTEHLAKAAQEQNIEAARIYIIPNMVKLDENKEFRAKRRHKPPVIGALGRFVEKKGFDIFLIALSILKQRGVSFRAILAGEGEERERLEKIIQQQHLGDVLEMPGWLHDTQHFYKDVDVFCLPSRHEPFGIVLLEAMRARLPIVTTHTEGPSRIVTNDKTALISTIGNAELLADAMERLVTDRKYANTLARNAYEHLYGHYAIPVVAPKITEALRAIVLRGFGGK